MSNSYDTLIHIDMIPNCFLAKYCIYPSPFYHNKQKYAKYEIMISYFVIFERFYQFFNKNAELPTSTHFA